MRTTVLTTCSRTCGDWFRMRGGRRTLGCQRWLVSWCGYVAVSYDVTRRVRQAQSCIIERAMASVRRVAAAVCVHKRRGVSRVLDLTSEVYVQVPNTFIASSDRGGGLTRTSDLSSGLRPEGVLREAPRRAKRKTAPWRLPYRSTFSPIVCRSSDMRGRRPSGQTYGAGTRLTRVQGLLWSKSSTAQSGKQQRGRMMTVKRGHAA